MVEIFFFITFNFCFFLNSFLLVLEMTFFLLSKKQNKNKKVKIQKIKITQPVQKGKEMYVLYLATTVKVSILFFTP